ncbi:type IV toxin-antitoxin system AbiEi family antitoxin domain-containing protein [Janibacter alkaliphilus]|uniref:AbiEi antitoxin N-terminal domain-containing protein n=1 Tax=Janibacter alkaliphilus TaxID=1069963 RepID=A0A852XBU8_9MICO|nr:type IV toxin-antitoxin system AbiEi family antitoxin domain-containing protein [Janibacter alkaliphilus]NYG38213.1 hypothetical protein [Janibacter alkaliphilus]
MAITEIQELAASQGGVVVTTQAGRLGADRNALRRAVSRGELLHLGRSVYALPSHVDTEASEAEQAEQRHRPLGRGLLVVYPDAVLAGRTAVVAHGLPVGPAKLGRARLERPVPRQVMTQLATIRPTSRPSVTTDVGPAVPVAAAVVQTASDDGVLPGVVAADAALHSGLLSAEELAAEVGRVDGIAGSGAACAMLHHCDGRSESVGESRLRVMCSFWGIPTVPQVEICDGGALVARADLQIEGTTVLLEFDGVVKYADGGVPALVSEKRREDRLRALGYVVVRVTWSDLSRPSLLHARIRRAVRTSQRTPAAR